VFGCQLRGAIAFKGWKFQATEENFTIPLSPLSSKCLDANLPFLLKSAWYCRISLV
jgi:hypothetical protein